MRKFYKVLTILSLAALFMEVSLHAQTLNISSTISNVACSGGQNGSIDISITGGSGNYSYLWSTGASTEDIFGLTAGTYYLNLSEVVTVPFDWAYENTGNNMTVGIIASGILVDGQGITPSDYLGVFYTSNNELACGGYAQWNGTSANFAIAAMGVNNLGQFQPGFASNEPLSFKLYRSSTGIEIPLTPTYMAGMNGLFQVNGITIVTNLTGTSPSPQSAFESFVVGSPTALAISSIVNHVTTPGGSDGLLTVSPSGGVSPYSYLWNNGATLSQLSSLSAGNYTVTVSDFNSCIFTQSFTITEPEAVMISASVTDLLCANLAGGAINLSITSGQSPYTITWSNGAITEDISNLEAGLYSVTVVDANTTSMIGSYTINGPTALSVSETLTMVTCNGGSNASIDITVNGGVPPYSYQWSNQAISQDLSSLNAGTYTLTLSDANNCQFIQNYIITEPLALSLSATSAALACFGDANGAINLTISGGTSPYLILWNGYGVQEDIFNLTAGDYSVQVWDEEGCTTSATFTVTQPSQLSLNEQVSDVSCFGNGDGSIDVSVSGGTPNAAGSMYTYSWSNLSTSQDISGLSAGTYTITASDVHNCTATETFTISEPGALTISGLSTDVLCNGGANASIDVTVSGGTPNAAGSMYAYSWSNLSTSQDLTGLSAGTYTITASDVHNCTATETFTISEPSALTISGLTTDVLCNGGSNASIDITVSGGTPNAAGSMYAYSWSNLSNTQDLTGISAGTYTVTVSDAHNCTITETFTISEPSTLTISGLTTNVLCNGGNNASVDVTVSGGTPNAAGSMYAYSWSNLSTSQDLTGLSAGTYTITVSDVHNCTATETFTISEPSALTISGLTTDVLCNGGSNASIDVTVSGGTPNAAGSMYAYSWSNLSTSQDLTGLIAGTYTITVSDVHNCTVTETFTISEPSALAISGLTTDVFCNGGSNASVDVTVSGGTPNAAGSMYTYSWSNLYNTQDISGLSSGTYTITVSDAHNCTIIESFTINEPSALAISGLTADVLCNGGSNASIDVTVSGGTPNAAGSMYTYSWSNLSTSQDINGLNAGTYTITASDLNNCTITESFTINEPIALTISGLTTDVLCNGGSNASVDVTVSGGTPNAAGSMYTYSWSNLSTSQDLTGLSAGTYTITASDLNNCTITESFTINEPSALTISGLTTDVLCNGGSNASIDVTVSGGTPNAAGSMYAYSWSNLSNTQDISGLSAGTYTITVSDAHNCTITETYTITEPSALTISGLTSDVLCNGGTNASIDVTVSGGTPNAAGSMYAYSWSNLSTSQDISGLSAGIYTITASDVNGCTITESFTIDQPAALQISSNVSDVFCFGGNNGSISVSLSGGTAFAGGTYQYAWSNLATVSQISILSAGTYTLTATDSHACTIVESFTVSQPAALQISGISTNVSCSGGSDGAVDVNVTGGTTFTGGVYHYNWSNQAISEDINSLLIGYYGVTVTDVHNCQVVETFAVDQPLPLQVVEVLTDVLCFDGSDGSVDIAVSGGTPNAAGSMYTYSWSNLSNSQDLTGLSAGTYTLTVTDAHGCQFIDTYTVSQPTALAINGIVSDVLCFGGSDASIDVTISGGTQNAAGSMYTYSWSNLSTNQDVTGLSAGTYTITATDAHGCQIIDTYTVSQPTTLVIGGIVSDVLCNGGSDASIDVTVSGGTPNAAGSMYTYSWSNLSTNQDVTGLSAGTYTISATDAHACQIMETFTVSQPTALAISGIVSDVLCFGGSDASIDVTVSGGTPNAAGSMYTYSWSNLSTSQDVTSLSAGTYTITATDAHGCQIIETYTVSQPTTLAISAIVSDVLCFGGSDASIDVTVSGGTPNAAGSMYTYIWSNLSTSQDVTGLSAGTFTITATDSHGCQIMDTYTVSQPFALAISGIINDVLCFGGSDASIDVTISGGTPNAAGSMYTYSWSNLSTSQDVTGLSAGTYILSATDAHGCQIIETYTVSQPTALAISAIVNDVLCFGASDASIDVTVSGGTPNAAGSMYTYSWSNLSTTQDVTGLSAGTYIITATDAHGCQIIDAYTVAQPEALSLNALVLNALCYGSQTGSVDVTVAGGTGLTGGTYLYSWSNMSQNEDLIQIAAGTYNLTVSDANACTIMASYLVTEPTALVLSFTTDDVTTYMGSDGNIDLNVTGGVSPYGYVWSNQVYSQDISNLSAGIYTVTVTDWNQCIMIGSATIFSPADVPDWAVTNTGYSHQISIPAGSVVEINGVPLTAGDYLGVFYNQQGVPACGGMVQYQPNQNLILQAYRSNVGQDNGFQEGEVFAWKAWKLITNTEHDVFATYLPVNISQGITHTNAFASLGISKVDSITTFFQATLVQPLAATWRIISINVIPQSLTLTSVISSINSSIVIMKNENGLAYWPQYNLNMIQTWSLQEGYQVKMSALDTLVVQGVIINPANLQITMPTGWSIVGYPRQLPANAVTMMAPVYSNLVIMKNQMGQVYWPQWSLNNIGNMKPGEGYQVKMSASSSMYFPPN